MNIQEITTNLTNSLSLNSAKPDMDLLEEAMSLNANNLDYVPKKTLLKYLVVLGQHLCVIKFAENIKCAVSANVSKVFENKVNKRLVMLGKDIFPAAKKSTAKERRALVIETDEELLELEEKVQIARFEADLVSGMSRPIEEFIQVLKKVLDRMEDMND